MKDIYKSLNNICERILDEQLLGKPYEPLYKNSNNVYDDILKIYLDFYSKNRSKIKVSEAVDTAIHLMEESMFIEIKKVLEEKVSD